MEELSQTNSELYDKMMMKKVESEVWGLHKSHQRKDNWSSMPENVQTHIQENILGKDEISSE